MRKWGILVTVFYALVLTFLVMPGVRFLAFGASEQEGEDAFAMMWQLFDSEYFVHEGGWFWWSWLVMLTSAQALLFLVSVDTSPRMLRPRRRLGLSVAAITIAVGLLATAALWSVLAAVWGDAFVSSLWWLLTPLAFWALWGVVFYLYREQVSARLDKAVKWLIAGSVLELLIAVPCHVIVRQRADCSAPGLTAFGIATGIAIMLMAFGPSVYFLYQKRLRGYAGTAR